MSNPSSARMKDVLRAALGARPEGLREPLLLVLVTTEDAAHVPLGRQVAGVRPDQPRAKLHSALRQIGPALAACPSGSATGAEKG